MRLISLPGFLVLLTACTGNPLYQGQGPDNIALAATTAGKTHPVVHIFSIDDDCRFLTYQGQVEITDTIVTTALPAGRPSYLSFSFVTTELSGKVELRANTLLQPVSGQVYLLKATSDGEAVSLALFRSKAETGNTNLRRADLPWTRMEVVPWTNKACRELAATAR